MSTQSAKVGVEIKRDKGLIVYSVSISSFLFIGVYFSSCVEQIKFVDFCGKYRLPLMQYLCSPKCTSSPLVPYSSSESDSEEEMQPLVNSKMKKVLLG